MSPVDSRISAIVAEIERDWSFVEHWQNEARRYDPGQSPPDAAYVAVALDHSYRAFESLLQRVHGALGLPPPTGERWHSELLDKASLSLPGLRPEIVPAEALIHWKKVLAFQHFFHNVYAVSLVGEKLASNVEHLGSAVVSTRPCVQNLVSHLLGATP